MTKQRFTPELRMKPCGLRDERPEEKVLPRELGGVSHLRGWCAATRQVARNGCSYGFVRYVSPRLLFGVEVMKKVFNALFAAALILGLASTLAANAQHGTAPQAVTSN